jgi:hypothetical protein
MIVMPIYGSTQPDLRCKDGCADNGCMVHNGYTDGMQKKISGQIEGERERANG